MGYEVPTGTVLAGFRVERLIGEGAMGAVYLAEAPDGGQVALKLLSPELARDDRFRQRFLRESHVAASLDHPHIVPTIASGEEGGVLYLAMAYVEGADLRELLRHTGRLEPERTLSLIRQVAEALDAAHAAGLVHRDVKPGNILVTQGPEAEQAYVCDFGLARHVTSVSSLTGERGFVGTIDYVPPEQIEGGQLDGRADVYSLGCVLYECLAGARPYDRDSELSVVFAHLNAPPPRVTDIRPELPEAFDGVFGKALAKSAEERYATCGELAAAARAALHGEAVGRRRRGRRRHVLLLGAAAVAAAAAALAGAFVLTVGGSPASHQRSLAIAPNSLGVVDAKTRRVVRDIAFRRATWDVAFDGRWAWALLGEHEIARIDPATGGWRPITLPLAPSTGDRIATGGGAVWVPQGSGRVLRIDRAGERITKLDVPGRGRGIAYGAGSVWVGRGATVVRLDPKTGRLLRRFALPSDSTWVVFADGAAWAASVEGDVTKIDPRDNGVKNQSLPGWISDLAVGGGFVWASVNGVVFRLSEDDLSIQPTISGLGDPESISFGGGVLWVANTTGRAISRIDPITLARSNVALEAGPQVVRYHAGSLWIGSVPLPSRLLPVSGGPQIRVSMTSGFLSADQSTVQGGLDPWNEQLAYATCANLLNYPDSAGPNGTRLRPEIAAAMPTLSDHGRTYTFLVRPGFRFSPPSNETVTAQTFRHTIERALSPRLGNYAPGANFASDIVGARAFRAGRSPHIAGISARGNRLSITLLRPAGDFLTRLSMSYFCPVPLDEPVVPSGLTGAIPSAGPYYTASIEGHRTVLLRNPHYAGPRPRHAARIVYTDNIPTPKAVSLAARGAVDVLPWDIDPLSPLWPGGALDRREGPGTSAAREGRQRYFPEVSRGVLWLVFNTRRPLFRSLRLRRAVNYALDRPALAAPWGAPPADDYVPRAISGQQSEHIYPVDGPDLRTARRLAGGRRRDARLYFCRGNPARSRTADIVRRDLDRIGIAVSLVSSECASRGYDPRAARADLLLNAFETPEPDPAPFLDEALDTDLQGVRLRPGPGPWNEPSFRRRLLHARGLRGEARFAAYARIDRWLRREAVPFAAFADEVVPEYFAPKVGCKLFQGVYHFVDLGALCLRR